MHVHDTTMRIGSILSAQHAQQSDVSTTAPNLAACALQNTLLCGTHCACQQQPALEGAPKHKVPILHQNSKNKLQAWDPMAAVMAAAFTLLPASLLQTQQHCILAEHQQARRDITSCAWNVLLSRASRPSPCL
jgi:hypothetical protein